MYMSKDIKSASHRPIGYWLKHLDRLIEDTFSRALAEQGLTRRHWQVLNTLAREPAGPAELTKALDPFLHDDQPGPRRPAAPDTGRPHRPPTDTRTGPANARTDGPRHQRRRIHRRHRHPHQDGGQPREQRGLARAYYSSRSS